MKARLNITIEADLLVKIKHYAQKQHISISELVESYFKNLAKPIKRRNIIDLVEALEKPNIDVSGNLKEEYYQEKARKYGF